jgi:pyrroline-5-carboxylate reductase
MRFGNLLLVGCGNMAGAMLEGWLASGMAAERFNVFDPYVADLPAGIVRLEAMPSAGAYDAILLGVKPQLLAEVALAVEPLAGPGASVLSLLAGVELATLAVRFPRAGGLVRVMPNLAVAIGKAPIGLATAGMHEDGRAAVAALMEPLGSPEWIEEADFDLFTALAGSGPAFVYRFIAALAAGAAQLGLEPKQAARIATAMVEGAAALAAASPHDAGTLADKVASPGGTTRAGLDVLDHQDALGELALRTLRAARDRSAEMSRESRA